MSAIRGRVCARAVSHVLLLAGMLLALAAVDARAAMPGEFYGVNSGHALLEDRAQRPAAFAAMRAGGLSQVRTDASWTGIEPARPVAGVHTYEWAKYDLFVSDLAHNGLRWYPMLGYSSPWATSVEGNPFSPPASDADFAAFAAAFAGRYGPGGSFWVEHPELPQLPTTVYGVWNEPSNSQFWEGPEASPARYMRLYVTARAAIRSVDPAARVATAGLLDSGMVDGANYLRAMLNSAPGARTQIDAIGWQPYIGDLEQTLASIKRARTTLTEYGLGAVPIEISEVGWHTGYSTAQRSEWMRGLAAKLPHAGLNVTRLMPYVWSSSPEWQITNSDGSLGPIGGAYLAGIRDAHAPQPPAAAAPKPATGKKASKRCKAAKVTRTSKTTTRSNVAKATKTGKATKKSKSAKKSKAARKCVKKGAKKSQRVKNNARKAKAARAKAAKARAAAAKRLRAV